MLSFLLLSLLALAFFNFSSPAPAFFFLFVCIGLFVDRKARVSRLLLGFQKIHIVRNPFWPPTMVPENSSKTIPSLAIMDKNDWALQICRAEVLQKLINLGVVVDTILPPYEWSSPRTSTNPKEHMYDVGNKAGARLPLF